MYSNKALSGMKSSRLELQEPQLVVGEGKQDVALQARKDFKYFRFSAHRQHFMFYSFRIIASHHG